MNYEALFAERLCNTVIKNLEKRGFEAYYAPDKAAALAKALELIPETDLVTWGGTVTMEEIGLKDAIIARNPYIDRDTAKTPEERGQMLRQAFTCDSYIMSTNAMTEDGQLVNIDGTGNRVAALSFGPKQVVMIVGYNKIAPTVEAAMARARSVAAPFNMARFTDRKAPCAVTGCCVDCMSPETICNQFLTTRRCAPAGRIKIILVGEKLGF